MALTKTDSTVTNIPDVSKSIRDDMSADGTRLYIDTQLSTQLALKSNTNHTHSTYAPLASPVFTGTPTAPSPAIGNNSTQLATTSFVNSYTSSNYLPLSGGNLSNFLTLHSAPTSNMHAATKQYVDGKVGSGAVNVQTFNSSGTWTKPATGTVALVEVWGAGGSGARQGDFSGSGGGGGGYAAKVFFLANLASTVAVTIGAGGASRSTNLAGQSGGNTTFGVYMRGIGGSGGVMGTYDSNKPGGLGGLGDHDGSGGNGGVGGHIGEGGPGGASYYGGGGGGGGSYYEPGGAGGVSTFAGSGGAGARNSDNAGNGVTPGGGGGGSEAGISGAGGNGKCIVTVF